MGQQVSCFVPAVSVEQTTRTLPINQFQLCRKGEIKQDRIEILMAIQTEIADDETWDDDNDYDLLDRCQ